MGKEVVLASERRPTITDEQVKLFTSVIAPGAPPDQVKLVIHIAGSLGLDPLRREVMLLNIKGRGDEGESREDFVVIINIHGMLKIAGREPDYAGVHSAVVYPGERCVLKADGSVDHEYDPLARVKLNDDGTAIEGAKRVLPMGAWATISRRLHGETVKITSFVLFSECAQTKWDYVGQGADRKRKRVLRSIWGQRPAWMIEKCALAFAVRKSYDHVLGRAYGAEEFGLVSSDSGAIEVPDDFDAENAKEIGGSEGTGALPAGTQGGDIPSAQVADAVASPVEGAMAPSHEVGQAGPPPSPATINEMLSDSWETVDFIDEPPAVTVDDVVAAARKGSASFKPVRAFLAEHENGWWLMDKETLAKLQYPKPLALGNMTPEELSKVRATINNIVYDKEGKRGRA